VYFFSVIIFLALRGVTGTANFRKFIRSKKGLKGLFFVHANRSSSCIRSCRTDLVIIFLVIFFARFRIRLLYFKLSFFASFHFALVCIFLLFFCCYFVLVNRK